MNPDILPRIIFGVLFMAIGIIFTSRASLTYKKETIADLWAIIGIIFLIVGIILILSPLLE